MGCRRTSSVRTSAVRAGFIYSYLNASRIKGRESVMNGSKGAGTVRALSPHPSYILENA